MIVCNIFPGILEQMVYSYDENTNNFKQIGKVTIQELDKFLLNMCYSYKDYKIRLYGGAYAEGLKEDVLNREIKNFNNNKITVEVF